MTRRQVVVLASGGGSTLQALLDAAVDPGYGVTVAAVGSDRECPALDRARAAGVPTFSRPLVGDREAWDRELAETVASFDPDLVVSAGFMRLVGRAFLERYAGRLVNSHPSLLPAFPGMHAARDALAYGVRVTGCTLFVVDGGVDTGPIVAQAAVPVLADDDEAALHERIKVEERRMLVDSVGRMLREGYSVAGRQVTIGTSEVEHVRGT